MINSFKGKYRFLSNFYPSPIVMEGITYPTVEHYFQAMKTTNVAVRGNIALANSPGKAKRLGRKVLLRKDWEYLKVIIMTDGLMAKFTTHPELRKKLIATDPHQLVEGNTWGDKYWGVCNGEGQNLLGLMLMLIRGILLSQRNVR